MQNYDKDLYSGLKYKTIKNYFFNRRFPSGEIYKFIVYTPLPEAPADPFEPFSFFLGACKLVCVVFHTAHPHEF